jgi:hypothetical protein
MPKEWLFRILMNLEQSSIKKIKIYIFHIFMHEDKKVN